MRLKKFLEKYSTEAFVLFLGIISGSILMFSSFSKENDSLFIASKAWSDFASHIPLIRSFSLGNNFPPEYPLYPGEAIKYHFGFYFISGMLEKIGIRIDLALNLPSIIGFTLLIFLIYLIAKMIFKSKAVGIISVIFFLFNSSLSYIIYFKNHSFSVDSILNIPKIDNFQSFAPYDSEIITAFWNLNIYTNQRHLAISLALSILVIYFLIRPLLTKHKINHKYSIIIGMVLGASFFLHLAVLFMTLVAIFSLGILFKNIRTNTFIILLTTTIISLPQYLYIRSSEGFNILLNPGYLISDNVNFYNLSEFWIFNLGLSIVLIPLGFIFANKFQKKIFISFIPIFLIGNIFQFTPEIAANHKFFNYFMIFANMYSAYALVIFWKKWNYLKPIIIIAIFFMIFGGIIDFFPIYNDQKIFIHDYESNDKSIWIMNNTDPNSVLLNTTYLYNPASMVGRKIYYGWPYFAWSQGYNTTLRSNELRKMLGSNSKAVACELLKTNKIDYVEINLENPPNPDIPFISNIWNDEFKIAYEDKSSNYTIYNVLENCN